MQPILGRTWLEWIRLSRIFRAPFANLSLEIVKKWVDTVSYLVFRGSSANLSPTCTFLERYLSRRHFKSMPVDLDYIKPFMGFCTTLIYIQYTCFQGDKVSWASYKTQVHKTEKAYANFLALDPPRSWCSCNGSSIKLPVCCWKIWRPCRKACSMAGNSKLN